MPALNSTASLPVQVIAAGVDVLASYPDDGPAEGLVAAIYKAMSAAHIVPVIEMSKDEAEEAALKNRAQSAGRMFGRLLNKVADYGRDEPASGGDKPKGSGN
jgi:hypothetical protein